jgi:hypothetical protein
MTVSHGAGSRQIGPNLSQTWPKKSPAKQIKSGYYSRMENSKLYKSQHYLLFLF